MTRNFLRTATLCLLLGFLTLTSFICQVRTESATITVPDDYSTIQEAINNALDGDTIFVKAGTYYENVVINKTVSIVGELVDTTIIDGNNVGHVVHVISDNVSISGLTLQNSGSIAWPALEAGICLNRTNSCIISENRLVANGFAGISLLQSQNNTIIGNNVTGAGWGGIHLLDSRNNTVSGNLLDSNTHLGINGHASSHYNIITENVISNSTYGMIYHNANHNNISNNNLSNIAVEGIELQDQVSYNTVSENSLTNCSVGIKLHGPNYYNTLSRNVLTHGQSGIYILNARFTEIFGNTIVHNYGNEWDAGIRLDSSGYSNIYSNLIIDNGRGVLLYTSSPHVSIYNNNISDNEFAIRVARGGSTYLNVTDNTVMHNRGYGVGLTGFGGASNYATISRNLIVNNSYGIALGQYSNYHVILQNNISQNGYGFYIEYSMQNTIWGNNISDNDQQVYVSAGSVNSWDGGYPSGGNFWSDYTGTDADGDAIGDEPYVINPDNQDRYPLCQHSGLVCDLNGDGQVDIADLAIASEAFGSHPGHARWIPDADLDGNDRIDIKDIARIAKDFGKTVR